MTPEGGQTPLRCCWCRIRTSGLKLPAARWEVRLERRTSGKRPSCSLSGELARAVASVGAASWSCIGGDQRTWPAVLPQPSCQRARQGGRLGSLLVLKSG